MKKKKASKKKPGRNLEELVRAIEKLLGIEGEMTADSPGWLTDKTTGRPREHDVVLTVNSGHHKLIIAIECRDRSRKIGVNDVESFVQKCEDTNVDHGVMVSPKGYWKTALIKAKSYRIRCLSLEPAAEFNWLGTNEHTESTVVIKHIHVHVDVPSGQARVLQQPIFLAPTGQEVSLKQLQQLAHQKAFERIIDREKPAVDKSGVIRVELNCDGVSVRDGADGAVLPLTNGHALVQYEIEEKAQPLSLCSYVDAHSGDLITQAAHSDITIHGISGKLMMVNRNAEGGTMAFVPNASPTLKPSHRPARQ